MSFELVKWVVLDTLRGLRVSITPDPLVTAADLGLKHGYVATGPNEGYEVICNSGQCVSVSALEAQQEFTQSVVGGFPPSVWVAILAIGIVLTVAFDRHAGNERGR